MAEENVMYDEEAPPEQATVAPPAAAAADDPKATMTVAVMGLDATQFPLFVVLVASVVLMIALGAHYDWKDTGVSSYAGYTISVASIAMILSFVGLVLTKVNEELYERVGKPMNLLVFLYSFVGACFLTFDKPFDTTSNGYFAAWAIVYGSAMTLGMTAGALGSHIKGLGALLGLLASSLVVIVATIAPIHEGDPDKNEAVYALALACVSLVFVLAVLGVEKRGGGARCLPEKAHFGVLAILAICWVLAACMVTFRGPFETTGNGYFASWAAAATGSMAAFAAKPGT